MSEKRKPDLTLVMQTANGTKVRYEIFDGSQFIERMQKVPVFHAENPNVQLSPVDLENHHFVRVRVDGVWLPRGTRALYPMHRVAFLTAQHMQTLLGRAE
jgi:hypothetical protein